jgi:hypothetical protein
MASAIQVTHPKAMRNSDLIEEYLFSIKNKPHPGKAPSLVNKQKKAGWPNGQPAITLLV